ncbi:hypothetical protein IFM89_002701 [Coptis chinensis]|uniref:Uncharacterized protein n=1 Tax=Coptis chinensis TaxID=261450 RepID=A0A835M410_9MAGN|nr:hypothetical protein IFM89_002701 [Coptis chinensis]
MYKWDCSAAMVISWNTFFKFPILLLIILGAFAFISILTWDINIDVLQREVGPQVMEKIEKIRILAQSALNMRTAGIEDMAEVLEKQLKSEISNVTLEDALTPARALTIISIS